MIRSLEIKSFPVIKKIVPGESYVINRCGVLIMAMKIMTERIM